VLVLLMALSLPSWPQINLGQASITPTAAVTIKRGGVARAVVHVRLAPGFHMNTNKPLDEYLIPLRLTWTAPPLQVTAVNYPEGKLQKYEFSEKPLMVLTGDFDIGTEWKAPVAAPAGTQTMNGKLRYQACDHRACYPPRSLDVKLTVNVQ
jgi:hypothetical protein